MKKVLMVCTGNMDRSPTAAMVLAEMCAPMWVTSAGTEPWAKNQVSIELVEEADVICVMEAVPALPTMEWSAASQPDRPLDASPVRQRPGDLAGRAGPQKGNLVWTTPNGCAVWPSTTRTLRTKALEEPGPGPECSIRRRWRSSASPRWSRSVALFRPTERTPMLR
jgi:hypothetical protein